VRSGSYPESSSDVPDCQAPSRACTGGVRSTERPVTHRTSLASMTWSAAGCLGDRCVRNRPLVREPPVGPTRTFVLPSFPTYFTRGSTEPGFGLVSRLVGKEPGERQEQARRGRPAAARDGRRCRVLGSGVDVVELVVLDQHLGQAQAVAVGVAGALSVEAGRASRSRPTCATRGASRSGRS
jgi:hypothetical protein